MVNESARETVGIASYNVSPPTVGAYFSKINCFCFTDQRLKAGEKREMAVVFFVDPELVKDSEQDGLNTITLSYTMYPVRQPEPPRARKRADRRTKLTRTGSGCSLQEKRRRARWPTPIPSRTTTTISWSRALGRRSVRSPPS